MFESLSTVFLIATDFEASRRFYTETLELEEVSGGADHVRYRIGEGKGEGEGEVFLVVHAPIADAEMKSWNLDPLSEPRGSGVVLTLRARDVDAAYETLKGKKADILFPPRDAPWGVRLFMVRDPSGFLIEISRPISGAPE